MNFKLIGASALATAMINLVACGGGGDAGTDQNANTTSGPITSFGSIYVNGREIETGNADIYIEDNPASESDLRVGMMVHVRHDGNGNAMSVHHDDDMEGIVIANNIPAGQTTGTMNIMGQTVTVTNDTIFESYVAGITDAGMIEAGNIVEVSGHSAGMGQVTATRMEVKATDLTTYLNTHSEGIELKGLVDNHQPGMSKFDIGSMTIDYSGAQLDDLPGGIDNGMYVEVKSTEGLNASGELVAWRVEREDDGYKEHHGDADDEHEVHGIVMAMTNDSITVDGQTCQITDQTELEYGSNINVGDMVEMEGYFNSNGDMICHEIEREDDHGSTMEMRGQIGSVNATQANVGTITMMDNTVVHVNADTIMHDSRDEGMTPDHQFNLQDLNANDYVEMYVYTNGDGTYTATKIEREDTSSMR
jgi:hypothetical protein